VSTSLEVIAFRDMGGEFQRMLTIKKFCEEQKVSYPKEVEEYFEDSDGIGHAHESEEALRHGFMEVRLRDALRKWRDEDCGWYGYEIDVADLPEDVKTLRFFAAW
jgi:hypothetical protein